MALLDGLFRPLAKSLLRSLGATAVLSHTPTTYDPASGQTTIGSLVSYTIKTTPPAPFAQEEVNGTTILATDVRLFLAAAGLVDGNGDDVVPQVGWTLTFDGKDLRVVAVQKVYGGDQAAMYMVQGRG